MFPDQMVDLMVFGSTARGSRPESDIDVLIVVSYDDWRLDDYGVIFNLWHDRVVRRVEDAVDFIEAMNKYLDSNQKYGAVLFSMENKHSHWNKLA